MRSLLAQLPVLLVVLRRRLLIGAHLVLPVIPYHRAGESICSTVAVEVIPPTLECVLGHFLLWYPVTL